MIRWCELMIGFAMCSAMFVRWAIFLRSGRNCGVSFRGELKVELLV